MNEDFYGSIDKLMEFGMSSKIATSMVDAMNKTMASMQMPNYQTINQINMQSRVAPPPVSPAKYFVAINDSAVGPMDCKELMQRMTSKEVTPDTMVWYQGLPGWAQAKTLAEVSVMFNQIPPSSIL